GQRPRESPSGIVSARASLRLSHPSRCPPCWVRPRGVAPSSAAARSPFGRSVPLIASYVASPCFCVSLGGSRLLFHAAPLRLGCLQWWFNFSPTCAPCRSHSYQFQQ